LQSFGDDANRQVFGIVVNEVMTSVVTIEVEASGVEFVVNR